MSNVLSYWNLLLNLVKETFVGSNEREREAMGSKKILWVVIGHKVSIFTRHRDSLHCGCLICYYIFISHENQSVAVMNFNCIQSRYVAVDRE